VSETFIINPPGKPKTAPRTPTEEDKAMRAARKKTDAINHAKTEKSHTKEVWE